MTSEKSYLERYLRFFKRSREAKGHDFHRGPLGSVPPPVVTFQERLRWWTWGRWRRMKKIRQERDHLQQDIIRMRQKPSSSQTEGSSERGTKGWWT